MKFYNTLTRQKEEFTPIDASNVRMYVCGVTPYDHSHIGHARVYVVFDVLYRLLMQQYGENHVTYVRNFTDIDDKIIARAQEAGIDPKALSEEMIASFEGDMAKLNCLPPNYEPKVTETMPEIIGFVENLIAKGVAYELKGDVYYDISKKEDYGKLSGKKLEDLIAGARVNVNDGKKNPGDFALWKAAKPGEPKWESPWGEGRPGWHIECSAMSQKFLGETFDIHGGGEDLQFPHHENEIAQSEATHGCHYANFWLHNAFITVEGRKMSKSDGNFTYIRDVLQKYSGEAIRLWLLQTHYRKPVDFSEAALQAAENKLKKVYQVIKYVLNTDAKTIFQPIYQDEPVADFKKMISYLEDDLNTPKALDKMYRMVEIIEKQSKENSEYAGAYRDLLLSGFSLLGLGQMNPDDYLKGRWKAGSMDEEVVDAQIQARNAARAAKNFAESDRIRDELLAQGIVLEDGPKGTTWRRQ